jgi:hypothetical protein
MCGVVVTFIALSIAARFVDATAEPKLTRTGIATPTLEPLSGVTEDIEGSATVPVDGEEGVVGTADVLGVGAVEVDPVVVPGTVLGAADEMVDDVVVAEGTAVVVSEVGKVKAAVASLVAAVPAHPVSSSNDPATAAPANLFPTAVPPT